MINFGSRDDHYSAVTEIFSALDLIQAPCLRWLSFARTTG
jgi:hypothetical protein